MDIKITHFLTRGETIKEEKIKSITRDIFPDTLVLENYEPFPGYYDTNIPVDISPMSVFIVLAKKYDYIYLARVMKEISTREKFTCDGTTATIDAGRSLFYSVRIKNLECFSHLNIIQESFQDLGIELHKGRTFDKTVLITVQKTFFLEKLECDIYKNLQEEYKYYFELKKYLTWDQFKALTIIVKNNIKNNLFDAAQAYFYLPEGITDAVRIYDRNGSCERITEIKDHYQKAIKRL